MEGPDGWPGYLKALRKVTEIYLHTSSEVDYARVVEMCKPVLPRVEFHVLCACAACSAFRFAIVRGVEERLVEYEERRRSEKGGVLPLYISESRGLEAGVCDQMRWRLCSVECGGCRWWCSSSHP